jgi:hypothetical protein
MMMVVIAVPYDDGGDCWCPMMMVVIAVPYDDGGDCCAL